MQESINHTGEQTPRGALVPRRGDLADWEPVARPVPAEGMRLNSLLQAFRERWVLATALGLLLAAAAGVATWQAVPAKYTAMALVRVLASPDRILEQRDRNDFDRTAFQKTQPALVTSRRVLGEAVKSDKARDLDVIREQPDPAGWLQKQIRAGFVEDSDTLYINLSGTDAATLEILVNATLDAYLAAVDTEDRAGQQQTLDDMRQIYLRLQESLRQQKEKQEKLVRTLKTADPQALKLMQTNAQEELSAHRREMAQVQAELRKAERNRQLLRQQLATFETGAIPDAIVDEGVEADQEIQKQKALVNNFRKALMDVQSVAKEGRLAVVQARENLKRAQEELEQMKAERRPEVLNLVRQKLVANLKVEAQKAADDAALLKGQLQEMANREKTLQEAVAKVGQPSFDLEQLRIEIEQSENTLKAMRKEMDQKEVEKQATKRQIIPFQRAETPRVKSATLQIQATTFAALAAFLCGAFAVACLEQRKRKIVTRDQVVHYLPVKVIGTLPQMPRRYAGPASPSDPAAERVLSEAVAYVRTMILSDAAGRVCPVVLVSSAEPQEGKTMLAGHLALSLAQAGRRTLVIDGDLRRPALARLFEVAAGPGLSEVLQGEVEWQAAVCPTAVAGLSVLPAGAFSAGVLRRLAAEDLETLFKELRANFDFILLDSGPLLAVSDGLLLGQHCDGLVMVVRPQHSRLPSVLSALEQVRRLNIPLWGVVVNGARSEYQSRTYYHYYTHPQGPAAGDDAAAQP
jgi:capsular exopolysaccharide synthesis family protein